MKKSSSVNVSETIIIYIIAAILLGVVMTIAYVGFPGDLR